MPLSDLAADWPHLVSLLDEALAVPAEEREAWLARLDATDPLKHTLMRLLTAGVTGADFLHTLPKLPGMPDGEAEPKAGAPASGDAVGPWRLLRELGEGGMGSVWLAERADGQLKRPVALKLPRLSWARGLAERMARERDILATLAHPHIARLYDAGVDQMGRPWLALEYVQGQPVDAYARTKGLTVGQRVELLLQVCEAVAYAHSRLVIHRDLKPGNILVTGEGQVKLLDFGIAKIVQVGATAAAAATSLTELTGRAFTLDYASPEQVRGEPLGTASDIYTLGVVAFELLAGTRPYRLKRGSAADLEQAIEHADPRAASAAATDRAASEALRGDLDAILQRALRKAAPERYATVAAFADDLRRHLAGEAVVARPDGVARWLLRTARRYRLPLGAGAVVLGSFALAIGAGATALVVLALLLGLGLAVWQAREARRQAHESRRESARAVAVQKFLLDVFRVNTDRQANPQQAQATTARELLDRGAERLDQALADWPEARAEVLEVLGEMYYQLGEDLRAAELDRARVAVLRRVLAPHDPRLADALITLAASLHGTPWRDEILPALHEAERVLDVCGDHHSALRGRLLVRMAQRQQNLSTAKMLAYAHAAVEVLGRQPETNGGELSTALHLLARAHVLQGEPRNADAIYERALQVQEQIEPPSHVALSQTRVARGEGLIAQGRYRDAAELLLPAHVQAEAALGARTVNVCILVSRLAHALHASGRRVEARALHLSAMQMAVELKGADDSLTVPIARMERARCGHADGEFEEALRLVEQVNAINRRYYDGSVVMGGGLIFQATLQMALGDFDAARAALDEGELHWHRGTAGGVAPWRSNRLQLERARLAWALGQAEAAETFLAKVVPVPTTAVLLPNDEVERDLLRVRVQLFLGDASGALALARHARRRIADSGMAAQRPAWQAEADEALAWALLARGAGGDAELAAVDGSAEAADAAGAAEALAQSAAVWRRAHEDPASPWTASAETIWAEALQAGGRSQEALVLATMAWQRLCLHPRLGPQFITPARGLLSRLAPSAVAPSAGHQA